MSRGEGGPGHCDRHQRWKQAGAGVAELLLHVMQGQVGFKVVLHTATAISTAAASTAGLLRHFP